MSIREALRGQVITTCFDGAPPPAFDDDYDLIDHGHIDSLRLMGLVSFIEQHFQVQFGMNDMVPKHFRNINAMAGYVLDKLGPDAAAAP